MVPYHKFRRAIPVACSRNCLIEQMLRDNIFLGSIYQHFSLLFQKKLLTKPCQNDELSPDTNRVWSWLDRTVMYVMYKSPCQRPAVRFSRPRQQRECMEEGQAESA